MNINIMRNGGSESLSLASAALAIVSSQGSASAAPAPRRSVLREIGLNIEVPSRSDCTAAGYTTSMLRVLLCTLAASRAFAQSLGGCPMFPPDNVWNTPVDALPVHPNSAAYVATIGVTRGLHPDFSATGFGIPFVTVQAGQPKVPV